MESLSSALLFWGILVIGSFFIARFFADSALGNLVYGVPLLCLAYPVIAYFESYRLHMATSESRLIGDSGSLNKSQIVIKPDGDGVEWFEGSNYSFFSWTSFVAVTEFHDHFALDLSFGTIRLKKQFFTDAADVEKLRRVLSAKYVGDLRLLS